MNAAKKDKREFTDVMIDLETLGTTPGCVILSIGAVDFSTGSEVITPFYRTIERASCRAVGLDEEADTYNWWMQQSGEAKLEAFKEEFELKEVLYDFSDYIKEFHRESASVRVWGNAASFDLKILEEAYIAWDIPVPWSFREEMCFRTLRNLFPEIKAPEFQGTPHVAICDAINQANHADLILKKVRECNGN